MCAACEMYEINLIRNRIAARMRERMRAEAVETPGDEVAAENPPNKPADETPAAGVTA